jgi:protein SCO1
MSTDWTSRAVTLAVVATFGAALAMAVVTVAQADEHHHDHHGANQTPNHSPHHSPTHSPNHGGAKDGADHSAHHGSPAGSAEAAAAPVGKVALKLTDVRLANQDGQPQRLLSDVIGDRIVVVGFVYTSCTTVCPVVSGVLAQVQDDLGERLGKDVRLVSLSIDPARDTPKRLKDYAANFRAKPDWLWLTGGRAQVDEALRGFGTYTPNFEDHGPVVMVGDGRTGEWTRFYGFASPQQLIERVNQLRAARDAAKTTGRG